MKRYEDCMREGPSRCRSCSLCSYGRDCHNNPVNPVLWYRTARGITQKQLADLVGVSYQKISKIERGEIKLSNLSLRVAVDLAEVLGMDARMLLTGEE